MNTAPLNLEPTQLGSSQYIPELDGFRAAAVLMVLVHHALYGWSGADVTAALDSLPAVATFVLSRGWLGVDLFFVLSGFLITGILLDTRDSPNYWKSFYFRRVLRILPIYLLVVFVCWCFYNKADTYFLLSALMMANFAVLFDAHIPHGPGVFWSLAVEEHFYLLWPFIVRFASRKVLTLIAGTLIVVIPIARGFAAASGMDINDEIYVLSWFRFDGLALGALLAIFVRSPRSSRQNSLRFGLLLFLAALAITALGWPFGLMETKTIASAALRFTQVQLVFAAAILTAVALRGTAWTALLRTRPVRITSDYSYCIYLVHLSLGDAIVAQFGLYSAMPIAQTGAQELVFRLFAVTLASYVVAALSFRFIESPMLRLKRFVPDARPTRHELAR